MTRTQPAGRRRPVQATGGSSSISALIAASRGRAVARLAHALAFRVAIVAAPACYDRGAVADECLRAGGVVHRRVSPAPGDSGIVGLLRSLAFAVSDAAPTLTSAYVGGPAKFADAPDGAEQLARWAAGELRDVRTTLVVEGVDVSDPRLAAFLAALVDRTHAGLRWLIVAETHALLPVARWMAEGTSAAPLDESDLAIAPIDLLRASRSLAVRRPEPLERLCRVAGGWPAAIALGVAAGPGLDIAGAPVERAALFDWLADAALAQLSPRERALLDATCLFDRIDPALLDALGWNDAVPLLDGLCDGLGLVRADADGGCRYDERLAAYLQRRLRARADGSFERITADAAHAYERAGRIEAAIGLRVAQRDGNAIGVLLAEHGFRLIDRGGSMLVARALECVGEDVLLALPSALAVKACLESLHGKFDVAEAWFRVALERADDASERLRIAHRLAVDLVRRERPDAIELLRQLTASLDPRDPLAPALWALLATAYAVQHRCADSAPAIARALDLLANADDPALRAKIIYQAGYVHFVARDIPAAKEFARRALAGARAHECHDVAARALSVLYAIAVDHDDDVAAARGFLRDLADVSVRAGSGALLLYALLSRYELEVLAGNVAEVARLNDRLHSLEVFFSVLTTETLLPAQALQAAWSGDFFHAYRLLEPSVEHQVTPERRAHRCAEIAVYAAAAGLRDEALAHADRAIALARTVAKSDRTVLQTLASTALAFVLLRRPARAAKLLHELAAHRERSARVARFAQAVEVLAARWAGCGETDALSAALDALDDCESGGLALLFAALPLPETARSQIVQLSANERDTLARLCAGQTPKQIAIAGRRNLARVDDAIASLCRKLGCSDTEHAVALTRAESLLHGSPTFSGRFDARPRNAHERGA